MATNAFTTSRWPFKQALVRRKLQAVSHRMWGECGATKVPSVEGNCPHHWPNLEKLLLQASYLMEKCHFGMPFLFCKMLLGGMTMFLTHYNIRMYMWKYMPWSTVKILRHYTYAGPVTIENSSKLASCRILGYTHKIKKYDAGSFWMYSHQISPKHVWVPRANNVQMPIGTGHQKGCGTSMALGIDLRRKRPKSGDIMGI